MRAWFNGRMEASQALDEGSIPFARFFNQDTFMENENLDLDVKPAGNKDLWLFLIILDIILLCVFGFFIYKYAAAGLFREVAPAVAVAQESAVEDPLPEVAVHEEILPQEEPVPEVPVVQLQEISMAQVLAEKAKSEEQPAAKPEESAPAPQTATLSAGKESVVVEKNPKSKYRKVTFRWYGDGENVAVVSGFTMSKPKALTKKAEYWETTLSIAPGTYKFLYVIDGKNRRDPYSPQQDGRSVVVVE